MTHFELMRQRLEFAAGIHEPKKYNKEQIFSLATIRWSTEFEQHQRNRFLMGSMRYGPMRKGKWNLIKPITDKVYLYETTGNREYLVDIANYCMLAFHHDNHPLGHFSALDDHHDHCKEKK